MVVGKELRINTHGNERQKEAAIYWADNVTEDIVYGGSKGSGKSYLGCSLIFANAFMYPGTCYFIARKTLSDLTKFTVLSIAEVFNHWGITNDMWSFNGQQSIYKLANGSRVYLIDAKYMPSDPTFSRLGSIQMTQGFIEEAGEFAEEAKNALLACVGRCENDKYGLKGKIIQTCNPQKNYLYYDYYKPFKADALPLHRRFVQALPKDNKKLQAGYLEHLERNLNETQKKRLLQGNWEYDDDPTALLSFDAIQALRSDENRERALSDSSLYCVTSDIARLGGDRIVIIKWRGYHGTVHSYKKQELTYTTAKIEAARLSIGAAKIDVVIDGDGIGAGVGDFGGFQHFRNNSSPLPDPAAPRDRTGKVIKENYDNLKSQCGFRIAERIEAGGVYLECTDEDWTLIVEELEQMKQKSIDNELKKGLIPKEKIRENIKRSPDFMDAILMREFFNLKTTSMRIRRRNGNRVQTVRRR